MYRYVPSFRDFSSFAFIPKIELPLFSLLSLHQPLFLLRVSINNRYAHIEL